MAMKIAHAVNVPMTEFWLMTPWQLNVCIESHTELNTISKNDARWLIWHQAAFQRCKEMPKLEEIMVGAKKKEKFIDEAGTLSILKELAAGKKDVNHS